MSLLTTVIVSGLGIYLYMNYVRQENECRLHPNTICVPSINWYAVAAGLGIYIISSQEKQT